MGRGFWSGVTDRQQEDLWKKKQQEAKNNTSSETTHVMPKPTTVALPANTTTKTEVAVKPAASGQPTQTVQMLPTELSKTLIKNKILATPELANKQSLHGAMEKETQAAWKYNIDKKMNLGPNAVINMVLARYKKKLSEQSDGTAPNKRHLTEKQ